MTDGCGGGPGEAALQQQERDQRRSVTEAIREPVSTTMSPTEFPFLSRVADDLMDWSSGPELDRLVVDLWVAAVEKLTDRTDRRG